MIDIKFINWSENSIIIWMDSVTQLFQKSEVSDFVTIFMGIVVEAFPFVVIGVLVSVLFGLFVKEDLLYKLLPKNRILSHMVLSLTGVLMPVCECGNVPVVRRFLQKKLNVSHAVTFLLAAPILNPITLWSTAEAFNYDRSVLLIRGVGAFLIANMVGLVLSFTKDQKKYLKEEFYHEFCSHDHAHNKNRVEEGLQIFQSEFIQVMKMMIFGASVAAASQVFIPREVIVSIGTSPVLSIVAMIVLAFIVSICANVDAFFALSYANTFTMGALLSFLLFGPMVDIKILSMLKTTFTNKLLIQMSAMVALSSFLVGLLVNLFY